MSVPPSSARKRRLERNLTVYSWFVTLWATPVFVPVVVLFWEENGLDLFDVFVLQALYALAVVLLEVPTGMVADRLGKRASILAGLALFVIGITTYGLGHSFGAFLLAELLWALATALLSGADTSLLYDSLKALGREAEYTRREGRARAYQMVTFAVSNLAGGLIGTFSYRATMWASMIGPVIAFVIALQLMEVQERAPGGSFREGLRGYSKLVRESGRFVRKHALVRWQIAFLAVLTSSAGWLFWLYQPYMEFVGIPVWAFGVMFATLNLFAAAASTKAHAIDERFGARGSILLLMGLQVAPLILMAVFVHPAAVLLVFGHQGVRAVARPIIAARLLRYTWADKRSTVLSFSSLAGRLFFAATAPIMGVVAGAAALPDVLLFQAVFLAVFLTVLWELYRRIPPKYFQVKDSVARRQ